MAFALPVRRGDFCYSSVFYADAGNNNLHSRASVAELAPLLRPETPSLYSKGRKPDAATPADGHPWHYWSAQLIHYGLPVTKHKNTAKVRLLNTLNQFKLEVPAWILKVESQLKKDWDAANRKLKSREAVSVGGTKSAMKDKKILDPVASVRNGVNVTVNLSFENVFSSSPQPNSAGKRKLKAEEPSPAKRKRSTTVDTSLERSPSKAVKVKPEFTSREPVKRELPSTPLKQIKKQPTEAPLRSMFKTEHESRGYYPAYTPSPPRTSRNYDSVQSCTPTIVLSGLYSVTCNVATSIFGDDDFDMTLSVNPNRSTWWATFRWGAWDLIMQLNPGPTYDTLGEPCSLGWRLRDLETGQLRFGQKCTGYMTFFEDQTFHGELYDIPGAGTVEFDGARLHGEGIVDDLRDEWDGFVREAYGR